ncbi:PH domain-containing protein [Streptomyces sp. NBC_00059]|uniref:PH domain-containing protein n=1 Tax=Streptomyces sp. NBC_00059 TaxID=2975635 RepID=UPI00225B6036|nr:PH domain-containing protein [Streptomyces sp. NBC_00059]MCX5410682.1 PH domain-containing protein [Streptomyces sp. NBC_00059]
MTDAREVSFHPLRRRALWWSAALGATGAGLAAVRAVYGSGLLDVWLGVGLLFALLGLVCLYAATTRVSADARGLRTRTLLRRRDMPWSGIADLRTYIQYGRNQEIHRVSVLLRDGRTRRLPLPLSASAGDRREFEAQLDALRALHRRHGDPVSRHVPVISYRAAGRGTAVQAVLCLLLLAGAGIAVWFVPVAGEEREAWASAVPCAAGKPAAEREECLSTLDAVVARVEITKGNKSDWLYFADGRPLERLGVSREGARGFHPGDQVELTVWRHQVREVTGEHHVWREHFTGAGEVAVIAAVCALGAGYPGARVLLHRRGRRLPDDEVLPSALPFAAALAGTAVWLLPLCYLHPMGPAGSPVALVWAGSGAVATLAMSVWAWRATRIRTPGDGAGVASPEEWEKGDRFLAARFLEDTDYNPNRFGTHIVLGDGPLAVTPHPGPGRFAARRIPVERLTVTGVRRVRGSDGDTVGRGWHIAELDDAGEPVRLAAAPADLTRILQELEAGRRTAPAVGPGPSV